MIASLMMYRRPELEEAHDSLWALVRSCLSARGIPASQNLSQNVDEFEVWHDPELVLSQTCGMPYRLWLHDKVNLVGTPDYGLDGCLPGMYRSALVIRKDDARETLADFEHGVFAYNQTFSQSGYAAPYAHLKDKGFWFKNRVQTGQHLKSAQSVAQGRADIAALDAVSWRLMCQYENFAEELRVLEWTRSTPGLPLITAINRDAAIVFDSVETAISQLNKDDRDKLGIRGLVKISKQDYLKIANPPEGV